MTEEIIELGTASNWTGETPFFLVIEPDEKDEQGNLGIDLDTSWYSTHQKYLRVRANWFLYHKATGAPVLYIRVNEGDQPYFTRHHVGSLMGGAETICYGIGKKQADGSMVRLWVLPNGTICGGDDVDEIALNFIG